jgi:hypothetical protein
MHDAQLMDIKKNILRKLQQFVSKECPFRDHGIKYISEFSQTLQVFVYKAYKYRGLKEETVVYLLSTCKLLKSVDIDLRSLTNWTLREVGPLMEEMLLFVTNDNKCHIGIDCLVETFKRSTSLMKFRVVESGSTTRRYMNNKCLYLMSRDWIAKTVQRLVISNTSHHNIKDHLMELIAYCSNITHSLSLKGFSFVCCDTLHAISYYNCDLQRFWLTRCGHNYNPEDLSHFMECCSKLKSVKIFDCPHELFSANKFTDNREVVICLTKLLAGASADQWTNLDGVANVSSVNAYAEEEDSTETDCCCLRALEDL